MNCPGSYNTPFHTQTHFREDDVYEEPLVVISSLLPEAEPERPEIHLKAAIPAPFLKMKKSNTVKELFEKDLTLKRKKSQVLTKIKQLDLTKKILEDEELERCLTQELIERENQIKLEKNAKGIMEETYSNPLRDQLSNQKTLKPLETKKQRTAADYWSSDDDSDSDSYEGRTIPIKPGPGKPIFGANKILKGTEEKKLPLVSVGSQYMSADGAEMHVVLGSPHEEKPEKPIIFPVSKRLLKPLERKEHTACISNRGDRDISQLKLKQHPDPEFSVPKADHRSEHVYGTFSWPLPEPIKWTKPQPVKTKQVTVRQRRKRAEKDVEDYKYHSYYGSKAFKKKLEKYREKYEDDFDVFFG